MGENFRTVSQEKKIQKKKKKSSNIKLYCKQELGEKKKASYAHVRSSP